MKTFSEGIIKYKKTVLLFFIVLSISCIFLSKLVSVNYNMMDYLPDEALSTKSLEIMENEYDTAIPNLRVLVKNISIYEALEYKEKLGNVDGVEEIIWLDDTSTIDIPIETINKDIVEEYYKENNALFSIVVNEEKQNSVIEEIREIIGIRRWRRWTPAWAGWWRLPGPWAASP